MIPESWLKTAIAKASRITLRFWRTKNGAFRCPCWAARASSISRISKSASSRDCVVRSTTDTASSRRPTWNSHRGVSGTVNSSRKKIAAGTAITANIQRQAISAGRRLAMTKFDR